MKATATRYSNGAFKSTSKAQERTAQRIFEALLPNVWFTYYSMSYDFDNWTGLLVVRIYGEPAATLLLLFVLNRRGEVVNKYEFEKEA